jgi:hypothetical protein
MRRDMDEVRFGDNRAATRSHLKTRRSHLKKCKRQAALASREARFQAAKMTR